MRLQATYSVPFFKRLYAKARKQYEKAFRDALQAYVTAMTNAIPVYSGESKASFTEAARLVGVPLFVIPAAGVRSKIAEGRSQGTANLTLSRASFSFSITSDVLQLRINDEFNAASLHPNFQSLKNPGPYNLNALGEAAFREALVVGLARVTFTAERRSIKGG